MSAHALTLTWSASIGSTPITYQPMFRLTGSTTFLPFGPSVSGLSAVVTGLNPSTSYDFDVVATNAFGTATSLQVTGATSSGNPFPSPGNVAGSQNTGTALPIITGPQNGAVATSAPLAITGLTIADAAATSGSLLVQCASGTVAMKLSGSAVPGSGTVAITVANTFANCQAAAATLIYTGPALPTTDTISVQFTDQTTAANTLLIQVLVVAVVTTVAPNAPSNLVASAPTNVSMQLNWGASTVGDLPITYQPLFKLATAPTFIQFGAPVSGLSAVISGLSAGQSYNFAVMAINAGGNATSAAITASTTNAATAPSVPTGLQIQSNSNNSLSLSWQASVIGSAPITYQPQFRVTGATVTTDWTVNPGQDGTFWKQPFFSTANWITSGPLVTALRNGSGGSPVGFVNQRGNFTAQFVVGKATDPLIPMTAGSKTVQFRVPVGTTFTTGDYGMSGMDRSQPYAVYTLGAPLTINTGSIQASGSTITTSSIMVDDATGPIMCDTITGQPGSGNDYGIVQDVELTQIRLNPNYIIPHMLAYRLNITSQVGRAGPIWPLKVIDTAFTNPGPMPQGLTIGIPNSDVRPTGETRGYYAWYDVLKYMGAFFYNVTGNGGTTIGLFSTDSANAALVSDMVSALSRVMARVCILNYDPAVAGSQFSLATVKGFTPGAVPIAPPPPVLDLSPTGGVTVTPDSMGAWQPSTQAPVGPHGFGYNVTSPVPAGGGSGPFVAFGSPIPGTSVTITGLQPNTSYDLDVIAINAVGTATSATITAATGVSGIPTDITGTQARPAQDMLNRFGINTHFGSGLYAAYTPAQAIAAIQSIGCTLVRDSENG